MRKKKSQSVPMSALTDKLLRVLDGALDTLTPDELLTDRQALRNLTGALKDLQELKHLEDPNNRDSGGAALTVSFEGDAAEMSK